MTITAEDFLDAAVTALIPASQRTPVEPESGQWMVVHLHHDRGVWVVKYLFTVTDYFVFTDRRDLSKVWHCHKDSIKALYTIPFVSRVQID